MSLLVYISTRVCSITTVSSAILVQPDSCTIQFMKFWLLNRDINYLRLIVQALLNSQQIYHKLVAKCVHIYAMMKCIWSQVADGLLYQQLDICNYSNMLNKIVILAVIMCWVCVRVQAYLEIKLVRVPHRTKKYNYGKVQCLTDLPDRQDKVKGKDADDKKGDKDMDGDDADDDYDDDNEDVTDDHNYKQICYEKDISYAIQLYNKDNQLLLLSVDLTAPISWVKGEKCRISQTHKKCGRIQVNFKDQIKSLQKKFKQLADRPLQKQKKKLKDEQYALIEGSSEVVKGLVKKDQNLQFQTRNSGHLVRLFDVLLIGLAIIDEKDILHLKNTSFISAVEISPSLNYLCDGAISMRFDQSSQSSFFTQITNILSSKEKYVTIYLGRHNQSMTIGDLSVKNSQEGLNGIHWIPLTDHENHGKLVQLNSIKYTSSESQSVKTIKTQLFLVPTLSSSSVNIPEDVLKKIITTFLKKNKCEINQSRYVQCRALSEKDIDSKQINFMTSQADIMLPLSILVLENHRHKVVLNIKSSLDPNFIIIGEPLFYKYFVVLDYEKGRIGIATPRTKVADELIHVIWLIRFVVWVFIIGCCCICLANPLEKCWRIVKTKERGAKKTRGATKGEQRRLKQYNRIEENPYDDIQGKIEQIVSHDQADGI